MSSVGSLGSVQSGFGALLRTYRHAAGLTQEELAERAGLSPRAIRELEHGRVRVPQRESVRALIVALSLGEAAAEAMTGSARAARAVRIGRSSSAGSQGGLFELPSDFADFSGRTEELSRLRALARRAADGKSLVVSVISGQGGIGKTALALHVGHEVAPQFMDGCLYVDLRGMDEHPADPRQVLGSFLSTLGLVEPLIPDGLEERAARFRSLLSKRRALLVLDNAADEAQVRPLLPGSSSCLVLVTSRSVLAGLETPHRLLLDVLRPQDALALLGEIVGPRADHEPEATAEVAALSGYLPLALRIAGNRLASRPGWSMEFLAGQMRDEHARLEKLRAGDLQVRAAFTLSYAQAGAAARLLFRRLSLVPGPAFGAGIAGTLVGTGAEAETVLAELADVSLIVPTATPTRYRLHDLARLFGAERLRDEEDEAARQAVEDRMLDWLLDTAVRAGEMFHPPGEEKTTVPAPPVRTRAEAWSWLGLEWANWLGAVRRAAELERDPAVCAVAAALRWYVDACGGLRSDWRELYTLAVQAARRSGDVRSEARYLNVLAVGTGRYARRPEDAREYAHQALIAAQRAADGWEEAWALEALSWLYGMVGRYAEALGWGERALALFRAGGYRAGEAVVLQTLGVILARSQRLEEALTRHRQALVAVRECDYRLGEGTALQTLGGALAAMGRPAEAVDYLQQAAALHDAEGQQWWGGLALSRLGSVLRALGRFAEAADHYRRAVAVLTAEGDAYHTAKALHALGITARELGDEERAREYWREALEIYEQLDLPQAEQVRHLLADRPVRS